jgi:FAD/FMN-containing dehydrogenase
MNNTLRMTLTLAITTATIAPPSPSQQTPASTSTKEVYIDDVSRLNRTRVREVLIIKSIDQLKSAVARAAAEHLKISIAGKRHSQGGQTFAPDALVLDMTSFNAVLALDPKARITRVQSGATWEQVQDAANAVGLAVRVQQSSNIFTVGGSMSVNVHGRDPREATLINTIESFRLLTADGSLREVSRERNPELFSLVIGGYGLFGIIVDVDLRLTSNDVYEKHQARIGYKEYAKFFDATIRSNPEVGLEFAWLAPVGSDLLRNLDVHWFTKTDKRPPNVFKLTHETDIARNRAALSLSRSSSLAKRLRWYVQETFSARAGPSIVCRNNVMRPEVSFLQHNSRNDTDILQEYFVPVANLPAFLDGFRDLVVHRNINLLNATVRYVPKDTGAFLSYATQDSFAIVILANQKLASKGRADAQQWTRELIDIALADGGTYYLPYQKYASTAQIRKAYPDLDRFFAKKRSYDPGEMFVNEFYLAYKNPTGK